LGLASSIEQIQHRRQQREHRMNIGLSDQVRALAKAKYVHPAILAGKRQFSIPVRDLLEDLQSDGFPARNTPQVCTALQTSKFLRDNGLEIEGVDGPPSKMSTTVVVRYRVANRGLQSTARKNPSEGEGMEADQEAPSDRALRLTEKLRGLLKDELAEYGGGEAFLRWVRSEDEDAA
jgi:hypothetical protein